MVASVVMSFSRIILCLKDRARSLRKEWYIIHSVNAISIPIELGPLIQQEQKMMRRWRGLCLLEGGLKTFIQHKTLKF